MQKSAARRFFVGLNTEMILEPYWNTTIPYNHSHRHFFDYIGESALAQHLAFVSEHTINPTINSVHQISQKIIECKKQTGRLPVLALDTNPWHEVEKFVQELDQHVDPSSYFVLSPDLTHGSWLKTNLAPFPGCLCMQNLSNKPLQLTSKKFRISYLSGTARYHRINLFKKIKPYVHNTDIVVINRFSSEHFKNTIPSQHNSIDLSQWLAELPWESVPGLLDNDQYQTHANNFHSINHPAYQACVNITGESNYNNSVIFLSEKTWKAYLAGCLVINFGVENLCLELENLGLLIWKTYDITGSEEDRTEKIIELFQHEDIQQVYQQHTEMIMYNQHLVSTQNFVKKLARAALDKIGALI
jgi:hypothetical protein